MLKKSDIILCYMKKYVLKHFLTHFVVYIKRQ